MIVWRTVPLETVNHEIGDRIDFYLTGLGYFSAVAEKVESDRTLFLFDEYVDHRRMNNSCTNKGGFEASNLKKWLDEALFPAFPYWMTSRMQDLSIPSVGEFFGANEVLQRFFERDSDEQLDRMNQRDKRIAYYALKETNGWLRNSLALHDSTTCFAEVDSLGTLGCANANACRGVRPQFWLKTN